VVNGSTQLVAVRQARASRQNATSADAMAGALGREWGLYRQPLGLERRRAGDPVWWRAGETACGGSMQENRTASGGVSYAMRAGELGRRRAAHGEPRRRRVARGEPGRRRAARRKPIQRRRGFVRQRKPVVGGTCGTWPGGNLSETKLTTRFDQTDRTYKNRVLKLPTSIEALFRNWVFSLRDILQVIVEDRVFSPSLNVSSGH
jgi:hypothetical protein